MLKEATAVREYHCHEHVYVVCSNVKVGGTSQSNIHMNAEKTMIVVKSFTFNTDTLTNYVNYKRN